MHRYMSCIESVSWVWVQGHLILMVATHMPGVVPRTWLFAYHFLSFRGAQRRKGKWLVWDQHKPLSVNREPAHNCAH